MDGDGEDGAVDCCGAGCEDAAAGRCGRNGGLICAQAAPPPSPPTTLHHTDRAPLMPRPTILVLTFRALGPLHPTQHSGDIVSKHIVCFLHSSFFHRPLTRRSARSAPSSRTLSAQWHPRWPSLTFRGGAPFSSHPLPRSPEKPTAYEGTTPKWQKTGPRIALGRRASHTWLRIKSPCSI